jgi:hypothetical protein
VGDQRLALRSQARRRGRHRRIAQKKSVRRGVAAIVADYDRETIAISAELKCSPAEIDQMPYGDSILMVEELVKRRNQETKWEAALHGVKLRR